MNCFIHLHRVAYLPLNMKIIIPLCGKGQRFKDAGYTIDKPFIEVFGKPLIQHVFDMFTNEEVYVFTNLKNDLFDFAPSNVTIVNIPQETKGAVETLWLGLSKIDIEGECLVVDGDAFYTIDIVAKCRSLTSNGVVYFETNNEKPVYSYIEIDKDNTITKIREKEKISNNANTGAYFFKQASVLKTYCKIVLDQNLTFRGEPYISCLIDKMLSNKYHFTGIKIDPVSFKCLGTPDQMKNYINSTYGFLFDLDGTLVNTDSLYENVWSQLLKPFGIVMTSELYKTFIYSNSDWYVYQSLLSNIEGLDTQKLSDEKERLFLEHINKIQTIEHAIDFIRSVKQCGHKIAIVTNNNRKTAETILDYIGIREYIDTVVIGSECKLPKPSPEPYQEAIRRFNIQHSKCIVFEDSKNGIISGKGVNPLRVVGISTNETNDTLLRYGADTVVHDYYNLSVADLIKPSVARDIQEMLVTRFPNIDIRISNIKLKGGFISDVLSLMLGNDNCVLKIENFNKTPLSDMASNLELYNREYLFYEKLASITPIAVPKFYGKVYTNDLECIGIVLEDLRKNNFKLNLNLNEEPIEVSLSVIDSIARMHAKFWNKNLVSKFEGITRNNTQKFDWSLFVGNHIDEFLTKWKIQLNEENTNLARSIADNFKQIQDRLSEGDLTLCHGDVKSPNIFYQIENNKVIPHFLDWQYIIEGKGVQDLIFFMIESFSPDKMKVYYPIFKNYYYAKLQQYGVTDYKYSQFEKDLKDASYYFPFFVAIWFGTTPEDELIDRNFPYFFIQKLFMFYGMLKSTNS